MNNQELTEIKGGAIKWAIVSGVAAVVTFIIGVVDGYFRPLKCNN